MMPLQTAGSPATIFRLIKATSCRVAAMLLPGAILLGAADVAIVTNHPGPQQFLLLPGQRAILQGYAGHGLEAWIYPFLVARDYQAALIDDGDAVTPLASLLTETSVHPEQVERSYTGQNSSLVEHWFVSRDKPSILIAYTLTGRHPKRLRVEFEPVLDLMWPGGIGGQETRWEPALKAFELHETTGRYRAYIGSPQAVSHSNPTSYAEPWQAHRRLTLVVPLTPGGAAATIAFSLTLPDHYDGRAEYQKLLGSWPAVERSAGQSYAHDLDALTELVTPDAEANRAFRWAELALEQAWVCNPYLGCGLVAGYGPSRDTRRPQYNWFFGGDGLVATGALARAGDWAHAGAEFAFLRRYQHPQTGMMWHEISQSAALLDWSRYDFQFRHVDISMDFVATAAHIFAAGNDRHLLDENWHSIEAAYRYAHSVCDQSSGVPLIPPGLQGHNEQLRMRDELRLSLSMLEAERGFAELLAARGDYTQAEQVRQEAAHLEGAIGRRYWDSVDHFVYQGFTTDAQPVRQTGAPIAALASPAFTAKQRSTLVRRLLQPDFLTAWGIRSTPSSDPDYDPSSYATGSVWPVGSAAAAVALWDHGDDEPAFRIWNALVTATRFDAPGHLDEVLSGEVFRPLDVSVPAQTWSSAAFVNATLDGLLGYRANAVTRAIEFSPRLPANWSQLAATRLPFGSGALSFAVLRTGGRTHAALSRTSVAGPLHYSIRLPLACAPERAHGTVDGRAARTADPKGLLLTGDWADANPLQLDADCQAARVTR